MYPLEQKGIWIKILSVIYGGLVPEKLMCFIMDLLG